MTDLYHEPEADDMATVAKEHEEARRAVLSTLAGLWEMAFSESQNGSRAWRGMLPAIEEAQRVVRYM